MTVASNLFTEDFFRIARTRLRPAGIFAQWIQSYSLGPEELRSILAAFRAVFPHVAVFEHYDGVDLLLLGSAEPIRLNADVVEARMSELRVRLDLGRVRIKRPLDIVGMYLTGGSALDAMISGARKNTDDNGLVEFAAPKSLYLDSQDANIALLLSGPADPVEVVRDLLEGGPQGDELRRAVIAIWQRRGHQERAEKAAKFVSTTAEATPER
jgi:spermidine synthase